MTGEGREPWATYIDLLVGEINKAAGRQICSGQGCESDALCFALCFCVCVCVFFFVLFFFWGGEWRSEFGEFNKVRGV